MKIDTSIFKIVDYEKECLRIKLSGQFAAAEAVDLREEVSKAIKSDFDVIYLDALEVSEIDLSGINEVIHSNFITKKADKKFIFLYKKDSSVEKWVQTTSLDKFTTIATSPPVKSA